MKHRFVIALSLLGLFGVVASIASAEQALTLGEARTLALAQSKSLQKALLSVDAATIDEKLQAFTRLPSLAASVSAGVGVPAASLTSAADSTAGISVTQVIFDATSSVLAAIDALATSIAQAEARAEYFGVLDTVDAAFYAVQKAAASVDAAQSDLESVLATEAVGKAKLDAGMISSVEYLNQEASVASKQAALVSVQGALAVAKRNLASITGLSLPIALAQIDTAYYDGLMNRISTLSEAQTESLICSIQEAAEKGNPSVSQAKLASQKAEKAVELAKADYLPSVSASWSGSTGFSGGDFGLSSALHISASMPLDLWKTRSTVDSKAVASRQAALDLEEARRTVLISAQQAVYDAIASAKSAASSAKALEYAERYYQSVQEQYRLSAVSAAELSSAALLVSTDRSSLIAVRYAFLANLSTLRSLAGFERDDLLVQLVP